MMQIKTLFPLLSPLLAVSILMMASFENSVWALLQDDIEEFNDLGEKAYYKYCLNKLGSIEDLIDLAKKICKKNLEELKNGTASLQQNLTSNSTANTPT